MPIFSHSARLKWVLHVDVEPIPKTGDRNLSLSLIYCIKDL
ncbi:hypothetical protein COO91_11047 (plasmid) [Nostoc flagelliforme CCNUN1]|uniref:Uncharacterized protein n=1 Tax=Nostoc flagelliforme CCNUN1 TaxID=2038116 RepID=A0A2K8T986_9NOSO|nr:hypothetical protein COO91_10490 [Nostoc flagelliforme CCNUN1]AUB44800.1 hypothetical protein COO91_11047 [Nostoc flagelliforme CCNUN1]